MDQTQSSPGDKCDQSASEKAPTELLGAPLTPLTITWELYNIVKETWLACLLSVLVTAGGCPSV